MNCLLPPACIFCEHYFPDTQDNSCKAFREIPPAIMEGQCVHDAPYPNDGGYRFRPLPEAKETLSELNEIRRELGLPAFRLETDEQ